MTPLDEAQIYDLLRTALIELFEIEPERMTALTPLTLLITSSARRDTAW